MVSVLASFGLLGFVLFHGWLLSETRYAKPLPWRLWWGVFVCSLALIIVHSAVYFVYASTPLSLFFTMVGCAGVCLWLGRDVPLLKLQPRRVQSSLQWADGLAIAILGLQGMMFWKVLSKATDIALGSPWLLFGPVFFVVYGLCLVLLFLYMMYARRSVVKALLTGIHFFLTYNIVTIIYQLGFGYDPFLHRAAEQLIFEAGFILPKNPFYIGQYVLVNGLAHISSIGVGVIDIWLVPLAASLLLPIVTYFSLRYGFLLSSKWSFVGVLLLPLYPLNTMFATTPHNFANLFVLLTVLLFPVVFRHPRMWLVAGVTAMMAMATHPLTGIFALWLVAGVFALSRLKRGVRMVSVLYIAAGLVLTPLLFIVYLTLQGNAIAPLSIISEKLPQFVSLFERPYYYINRENASLLLDALYVYQWAIPFLLIALAVCGFVWTKAKHFSWLFVFFLLMFSNAFFVSTWITLPNLDAFEQIQYAERLRHISVFFLLPLSLFGLVRFVAWVWDQRGLWFLERYVLVGWLAVLLTSSWYLTYPQRNAKVHFPGYNVTGNDIAAAEFIFAESGHEAVVLSNILTAAASIDTYGFAKYFDTPEGQVFHYAIPSGGPLYERYLKMLYEGQKREYMGEVIGLTGAPRAYFVVNSYWHKFPEIVAGAQKTADGWRQFGDGAVWVFWYEG